MSAVKEGGEKVKLQGSITICKSMSTTDGDRIRIEIRDELSRARFVELIMSVTDFGYAITGLSERPCNIDVRGLSVLGKRREHKTELISVPDGVSLYKDTFMDWLGKAVLPHEVDGWKAEPERNAHRMKNGKYSVIFIRYVDVEEDPQ
jgi:hypothetical protein